MLLFEQEREKKKQITLLEASLGKSWQLSVLRLVAQLNAQLMLTVSSVPSLIFELQIQRPHGRV